MEIRLKIVEIIVSVLQLASESGEQLEMEESLYNVGMDSINCVEIILLIEEEYGIEFGDEELMIDNLNTLQKLCEIVELKREQQSVA